MMPLLDHFHPPLSVERPWEGVHSAWAAEIAAGLNRDQLPPDYFAMPLVTVGGRVEVDVGTFEDRGEGQASGNGGTAVWAPPQPTLTIPLDVGETDSFEVQVLRNFGGPQLRAAIELVSPANRDRASAR